MRVELAREAETLTLIVRPFMPRTIIRSVVVVAAVASLAFATPWAVRPFLYPPQGLHPTGWTYSQLIRDRYPRHLIDPDWLSNDLYWNLAETGARVGILAFGAACVFAWWRFTRHTQTPAQTS